MLLFFVCLFISSITFLAYDFVSEEIKKLIIWINVLFFDFNHSNDDLCKIQKSELNYSDIMCMLLYEISISRNHNWQEKVDKIRIRLIKINQLDFFYYTSWLRKNFDFCMNREYDQMKSRKLLLSNKKIV